MSVGGSEKEGSDDRPAGRPGETINICVCSVCVCASFQPQAEVSRPSDLYLFGHRLGYSSRHCSYIPPPQRLASSDRSMDVQQLTTPIGEAECFAAIEIHLTFSLC
jgi:hypothetical protein